MMEVTKENSSNKKKPQKQKGRQTKRQKTKATTTAAATTTTVNDPNPVTKTNETTNVTTSTSTETNSVDHSYFRVVTGSYERLLYGIDVYWNDTNQEDKASSSRVISSNVIFLLIQTNIMYIASYDLSLYLHFPRILAV